MDIKSPSSNPGSAQNKTIPTASTEVGHTLLSRPVESPGTSTEAKAKQSLLSFHFWGFLYDVDTLLKPLSDYIMSRPSTKKSLFSLNLTPEETLSMIANLANEGTSIETLSLENKSASISLKRLADNIRRAKEEGAEAALNHCIDTTILSEDTNKQKIFENAYDLLNKLENKVNELLEARVEGYKSEPTSSKVVLPKASLVDGLYDFDGLEYNGELPKAFNRELFNNLKNAKESSLSTKAIDKKSGEILPLSEVAWSDFESTRFNSSVLINKKGERRLFSDIAKEGKPDGYQPTGRDLLEALRKFCGYKLDEAPNSRHNTAVDEKVFKISRYFCQNLGNNYVITTQSSEESPQRLGDGTPFTVSKKKELEQCVILTENEGGFRIEANGKYNGVSAVSSITEVEIFFTDQSRSNLEYRVGIDLIEGPDGKLVEQEYTEGYLKAKIVLLPPTLPAVPSQASSLGISGSFSGEYSPEFRTDIFRDLMNTKEDIDETTHWMMNPETGKTSPTGGVIMPVCTNTGKDFLRMSFATIDKQGTKTEFRKEDYPEFTKDHEAKLKANMKAEGINETEINAKVKEEKEAINKKQVEFSEKRIAAFLKICGYDPTFPYEDDTARNKAKGTAEAKLFKLSRFMHQGLASGFMTQSMLSENSPMKLSNGDQFTIPPENASEKKRLTITENPDGNIVIEIETEVTDIKRAWRFKQQGNPEPVAPGAYFRRTEGIIFTPDGNWEEYKKGELNFNINILPATTS